MQKLQPEALFSALRSRNITHFFGVPDLVLKNFCACVASHAKPSEHIIAANEGSAVAMAAGHQLATGHIPAVYAASSGLPNALGPLLTLTHAEVHSIPMLLVVGSQSSTGTGGGHPHATAKRHAGDVLRSAEIPFSILSCDCGNLRDAMESCLDTAVDHMRSARTPYALLVAQELFEHYPHQMGGEGIGDPPMTREEAIEQALRQINREDIVVAAAGLHAHEIFGVLERGGMSKGPHFFPAASAGHCSSIAAGIALAKPERSVYCFDGDGAFLMHMGSTAVIGGAAAIHSLDAGPLPLMCNYRHVVFNNGTYDSAGGQPTASFDVSLTRVASACGFKTIREEPVIELGDAVKAMQELKRTAGPAFLEIIVRRSGNLDDSDVPTPLHRNKLDFIRGFTEC